jgi:simple sugar transport system substrate-binding protein
MAKIDGWSRRRFLMTSGATAAGTFGLAACGGGGGPSDTAANAASGRRPWLDWISSFRTRPKIAVSCFATANPFFGPCKVATQDTGAQLGIETTWSGPSQSDTTAHVSQFQDLVNQKYDVIVLIPGEAKPWVEPIRQAVDRGVLVLTANQDAPGSARELFFGQDLFGGGKTQAKLIQQLSGGTGKVAVTNCAPGSDAMNKRIGGVRAGLKQTGVQLVGEFSTDPTDPAKLRGQLEDILRAHGDLSVLAPGCGPDTAAAGKLRASTGKKFKVVGHDMLFDTLQGIKNGTIDATLGQNPYVQVYLPIMYGFQRVTLGAPRLELPNDAYDTGTELVTKDNVETFIKREARFKG